MARTASDTLTTAEAKARLLRAARNTGPKAWIRRRPFEALLVAGFAGILVGGSRGVRELAARGALTGFLALLRQPPK